MKINAKIAKTLIHARRNARQPQKNVKRSAKEEVEVAAPCPSIAVPLVAGLGHFPTRESRKAGPAMLTLHMVRSPDKRADRLSDDR